MKQQFKLTEEGREELQKELEELIASRPLLAERIKLAREFGDLSENAEYSAARQEQEKTESRIAEITHILENVLLIKKTPSKGVVGLGSTVELRGNEGDKTFIIVGSVEADPLEGKISNESPIGQALLGKKIGDSVEIKTPADTISYSIVRIS
jgi:transcription elongation factor GreA